MMSPNKPYNTKDSSEYFAEFYKEYCLDPTALKKQRPSTYEAIVTAVNCLNNMSETYLFSIKRAYEKRAGINLSYSHARNGVALFVSAWYNSAIICLRKYGGLL